MAGQPRKLERAEQLTRLTNDYVKICDEKGVFPNFAGLKLFIQSKVTRGFDVEEFFANCTNPDIYGNKEARLFKIELSRGIAIRREWLERACVDNPKGAIGYKFLLIQPENGGLVDKNLGTAKERKLTIVADKVGGKKAFQ